MAGRVVPAFRLLGGRQKIEAVIELLKILLAVVLAISLATIVVYALGFFAIVAWTVPRGSRRDPFDEELERFLAELWDLEHDRLSAGLCSPLKKGLEAGTGPRQRSHGRARRAS